MTRLILIRHGMTDDNLLYRLSGWTDSPLNEVGIRQAECVADRLAELVQTGRHVHAVYASPLQRARKTAEIVANRLKLPVVCMDELKEMNFGVFEGVPILKLYETHKEMVDKSINPGDDGFGWEGGETRPQIYSRIQSAILKIAEQHAGETVAVVTHGGAIAYFITGILGKPLSHWGEHQVANCSLTSVIFSDGKFELESHNDTAHVPKEQFADLIEAARKKLNVQI